MKQRRSAAKKQSGVALILFLVALILAGSYAFYRSINVGFGSIQQNTKLTLTLARAKEALIANAAIDDKRPGRLLCPDIIGAGNSDWSLSRTYCDTSSGWLPWKTLGLNEGTDEFGTKFWYAFTPAFGGTQGTPLNSDTPTSLFADNKEAVAIIIATRGALDTRNADGDQHYFTGTSQSSDDNDVIAVITRQELMAAVEKRIANELRTCLEQHATNTADNPAQTYPWPAPLSNDIYKGVAKSLFGMVPSTQPGSSPDELLQKSVSNLNNSEIALNSASTATDQLAALQQIQKDASYARTLFDRLYILAADLVLKADTASSSFNTAKTKLSPILVDSTTFRTGSSAIPAAIASTLPSLAALRTSLANSGFDTFLHELETQNSALNALIVTADASRSATNFGALQTQANLLKRETLGTVSTPNPELANLITTAANAATAAVNAAAAAKASPGDTTLANLAIASANNLSTAIQTLAQTIKTSRLTIDPAAEVAYMADVANNALTAFSANVTTGTTGALLTSLESASTLITSVATGSATVLTTRASALSTLQTAINAAKSGNDVPLIQSASTAAIADLKTLVTAMENNGDNILIDPAEAAYTVDIAQNALTAFSANVTKGTTDTLLASLESASKLTTSIATGSVAVLNARKFALNTLQTAIAATKSGNDVPLIQTASTTAIADLRTLVTAMENNGDNILLETLENIATQLEPSAQTTPATLTAGKGLLATVNAVKSWADIVSAYAEDIARKSRKGTSALGDSDTSAYTQSRQLLSSIDGSTGSIAKLEAYINAPTDTTKQSEAIAAVAATKAQLADTISAANQLDTLLKSGLAQAAMPTRWYGDACTPLNPPTGNNTWWVSNEWRKFFFYQISARVHPAGGTLTVNGGAEKYRVVVISTGSVLTGQDPTRNTRKATHYLEGINADTNAPAAPGAPSSPGDRDEDAQNPPIAFSSGPVSAIFNDRLAY